MGTGGYLSYGRFAMGCWLQPRPFGMCNATVPSSHSPTSLFVLFLFCFWKEEGNILFNDALNTFYLRLYSVRHMVKDHSDSERGNPLPPHRLLFPNSSKGYFICIIPQTGSYIPRPLLHQSWITGWNEK